MKASFSLLLGLLTSSVSAHYTIPSLIVNGSPSSEWQYIRMTTNHYSNGPVTNVRDSQFRCYELDPSGSPGQTGVATVAAGSQLGFKGNQAFYHPGFFTVYMSKASPANSASAGTGQTWFKVWQNMPTFNAGTRQLTFPSQSIDSFTFTVPRNLPSGDYLVRAEQAALHGASSYGGAQFYISCAQITVTGGGSGSPSPLVSIPGVYTGNEPGILINIYNLPGNYSSYPIPGPAVWSG